MKMMKRAFLVFAGFIILGLEAGNHEENLSGCDALNPVLGKTTVSIEHEGKNRSCLLYTSPSPRDLSTSRMPSSA